MVFWIHGVRGQWLLTIIMICLFLAFCRLICQIYIDSYMIQHGSYCIVLSVSAGKHYTSKQIQYLPCSQFFSSFNSSIPSVQGIL